MDIVEGSAPSEMEKETAHRIGAKDVGASASVGSFARKDWRSRMMVIHLG
jgi:hypothetical protein